MPRLQDRSLDADALGLLVALAHTVSVIALLLESHYIAEQ